MITESVLIDTGPLVALLHRQDSQHTICTAQARLLKGRVFTSWPVVTEAAWLLRGLAGGLQRLVQLLVDQDIVCLHLDSTAGPWLLSAASKYKDIDPQLADLTLLYLAERYHINYVFTLDRRDFAIYRNAAGEPFKLLPETL